MQDLSFTSIVQIEGGMTAGPTPAFRSLVLEPHYYVK